VLRCPVLRWCPVLQRQCCSAQCCGSAQCCSVSCGAQWCISAWRSFSVAVPSVAASVLRCPVLQRQCCGAQCCSASVAVLSAAAPGPGAPSRVSVAVLNFAAGEGDGHGRGLGRRVRDSSVTWLQVRSSSAASERCIGVAQRKVLPRPATAGPDTPSRGSAELLCCSAAAFSFHFAVSQCLRPAA